MENNNLKGTACFFKRFFYQLFALKYIFLFMCPLLGLPVSAQKINKDYLFYPQENGNLYFILPQKGFKNADKKGLEYDITYQTSKDSLIFSFTYINREICKPERISILSAGNPVLYEGKAQVLFVQPQKKDWEHRGCIKIPYEKAISLYATEEPFQIQIHTSKNEILFQIETSKWKNQQNLISRIFEVINQNN